MKVAMIPARGGSKRIPRKNIKNFRGKPIIAYSIEAALESGCFDKVIVSTDDEEIAKVAEQFGAEIPFIRPANISDDYSTTVDVIKHCLYWFAKHDQAITDICCIYATAPFVEVSTIKQGEMQLNAGGIFYAFTVSNFSYPIQRSFKVTHGNTIDMFFPQEAQTRSQDLTEAFHDAGQLYWGKAEAFLKDIPLFSKQATAIKLPSYKVQDIDTIDDWIRAEAMHEVLERSKQL